MSFTHESTGLVPISLALSGLRSAESRMGDVENRLAEIALSPGLDGLQRATATLSSAAPLRVVARSEHGRDREVCVDLFSYGEKGSM